MVELHPHGMAHGGEAVARRDGKAHFIYGAMPGDIVETTIIQDKGSWARTELVEIIDPSPLRRSSPCPYTDACGGCQWQFTNEETQRSWKHTTVSDQLRRLGRIENPTVHDVLPVGPDLGYRNRMDFHVVNGRPGLYRHRSNDIVHLDACLLLVPELSEVYHRLGNLEGAQQITLRAGTRTGDRVALVTGEIPDTAAQWGIPVAQRVGGRIESVIGVPRLTEIVDGATLTIPLDAFFQNNTPGADLLVQVVKDMLEVTEEDTLLDGYCGVGLFGATVGRLADRVVGIDSTPGAIAAARVNLTAVDVDHNLVAGSFTREIESLDEYWDVAVVDPPRKGLGRRGIEAVTSAMPRRIAYVACDPASLARDAAVFPEYGYEFIEAVPVDLFPQTYHIETVARFDVAEAMSADHKN